LARRVRGARPRAKRSTSSTGSRRSSRINAGPVVRWAAHSRVKKKPPLPAKGCLARWRGRDSNLYGAFPVKCFVLGFADSSLFEAGKAVLRPVACDQIPGARGRGQRGPKR
jgi:hypothetical protein